MMRAVWLGLLLVILMTHMMAVVPSGVTETGAESALNTTLQLLARYQSELEELLSNEEEFLHFKEYNTSRPLIWMVLFGATLGHDFPHITNVLQHQFPHLRDLFFQENSYQHQVGGGSGNTDLRYVYDLAVVERVFGILPGGFARKVVVEVGGGYGGMAHAFSAGHELTGYHVVDKKPSLLFQQKYLSSLTEKGSRVRVPFVPVLDTSLVPVRSDLFYSFLAIDEVSDEDLNRYIQLYLAHAQRGYLLLAASRDRMFTVFECVWAVQPRAVMLPPDIAYPNFGAVNEKGQGVSVRIVWDNSEGMAPARFSWLDSTE